MPAWSEVILVTDDDLTAVESTMPEIARQQRNGVRTPLDSKRALAKDQIARELKRRGYDTAGLLTPEEDLKQAAVYLELSMIYQDMAGLKGDAVSFDKSAQYRKLWEEERDGLSVSYDPSLVTSSETASVRIGTVELRRA